uniref:Uncharacterized protein n=1 Tax=Arundo donax TaxID=35708 RepID=A0A0A9ANR0_ARUDO
MCRPHFVESIGPRPPVNKVNRLSDIIAVA